MLPTGLEGTLSRVFSANLHHCPVEEEKVSDTTSAMVIPDSFGFGERVQKQF